MDLKTMAPEGRARLLERLASRAERLAKTARLTDSPAILALMAEQVMKTAMAVCGPETQARFLAWLTHHILEDAGLCGFCGRPKTDLAAPMCQTCWDECAAEDRADLIHEADDTQAH